MTVEEFEAHRQPTDESLLYQAVPERAPDVRSPAIVHDATSGRPVIVTVPYPDDLGAYRRAILGYPMDSTVRAGGVRNVSRVFGYSARMPLMQRNCCRLCSGGTDAPEPHGVICQAAGILARRLASAVPDIAAQNRDLVRSRVLPDWILHPDAWWTSGVVNRTSPLPYHRDRNNLKAWSAMVVLRRGVKGGHLHVPEYDLTIECRDGDVVYFGGYELIHGVTPMVRAKSDGYRFSAVYYPVAKMANCLAPAEEMERGRAARSAREDDLLVRQRSTGTLTDG